MPKICLFGGTTEGRRIADFLNHQPCELTVCVATEYGAELLQDDKNITLSQKKLSDSEITNLLTSERFDLVIDATHPYALQATENIFSACSKTGIAYLRVLRNDSAISGDAIILGDIQEAVDYLNNTEGNILLTTGSKELSKYSTLNNFSDRVYARVLPMRSSLEACEAAGLKSSHIIAMQGPFSEEINMALIHSIQAKWLVTKDSGETGGFAEKISAAQRTGARPIIIGRPKQLDGLSESDCIAFICARFGFNRKPKVIVIGLGPGNPENMTLNAHHAITNADCVIGAKRTLQSVRKLCRTTYEAVDPDMISNYICTHCEYRSFAVLMSGDSGFYSGTKRLLPKLQKCTVEVLPGISSLSQFCSKLRVSYENVYTVSLHGRDQNIIPDVRRHGKTFVLTGGDNTAESICKTLFEAGLKNLHVSIGEKLSYPKERISCGTPEALMNGRYDNLSVMLIENDHPDMVVTHGLPDNVFLRDSGNTGVIPMTKSEVRSVCLSRLALTVDSVCWDIGSGTGSVAIEMALQAHQGTVYAIEQDTEAIKLSQKNAEKLMAENINFIHGSAPEACKNLPTPSHVFIGGSSGHMKEIFEELTTRNSEIRVTATAITLESITELYHIMELPCVQDAEVLLMHTAQSKKTGTYHLMLGGNPVYIFSMRIFRSNA